MNPNLVDDEEDVIDGEHTPTVVNLTDWANAPTVEVLKADLEASRPAHDRQVARISRWNDLLHVRGSVKMKKVAGRSNVQPKLIRRQAEWRYAALTEPFLSSDKLFSIDPVTFEDEAAARQSELVLNYQFRAKLDRVKFIDDFIRTNVDDGSCIVRLGWYRHTVPEEVEVPVWAYTLDETGEIIPQLQQLVQLKQRDPRTYDEQMDPAIQAAVAYFEETGQPVFATQQGTVMQTIEKVIDNRPTVEIMDPNNVYIDPSSGGDIDKAGFVVVSFETSQADLRKQSHIYKNLDNIAWEHLSLETETDHTSTTEASFNFKDPMRKRIVAYEYWGTYDIHGTGILVPIVATWVGGEMIRLEVNPFPDQKPPFVVTSYLPVKREMFGEPDAEFLEDNQKVTGAIMRGMIDLMGRSANSQRAITKGALDPVNERRFMSGQNYQINPGHDPRIAIHDHAYPEIPASAMNMIMLMNQEAEAMTGVKAYGGGLSGEAYGDVAAGIRGVLDAASKREMGILRRMANGVKKIGAKIASMNTAFLSEEETVRVTNKEYVVVRREDLIGNYDLEVDIATAEVDNAKAQDLGFMLQTIGNNMDFGIVKLMLAEIARLKRMPVLEEQIRNFEPQPDPMVEQMKQLELQMKQAELQKVAAEIEALKARAYKDMVDAHDTQIETVERETGTTHERELEKQRAQSHGNQNLELTKALLKPRKKEEAAPDVEAAAGWNALTRQMDNVRPPDNYIQRNDYAQNDPRLSISSKHYEPSLDPARNPALRGL